MVINGEESESYDDIREPIFSPDGRYVCYGARIGNELWWVVDEIN